MKRIEFLKKSIALGLSGFMVPSNTYASNYVDKEIEMDTIKEFVQAGHKDLQKVKEMLKVQPNLLHTKYDWGNGDFEDALEGAGHVGNVEIANYLISQGARANIFVLTMLGKTKLVKPILKAYPALIQSKGPHGFTLLHHAKIGGDKSKKLYNYLLKNGLSETKFDFN